MSENGLRNFFFGEKRSLMQSIVDGAVKSAFSGLLIAVAGLYLINAVEKSIELTEKKSAFKNLQNTALSNAILEFSNIYSDLTCSRDHSNLVVGACNNEIDLAITKLNEHHKLLNSLFANQEFISVLDNIEILRKMKHLKNNTSGIDSSKLLEEHSDKFAEMIANVSENYR